MVVIKRDGTKVPFQESKIVNAVYLANSRTSRIDTSLGFMIKSSVMDLILNETIISVNKIECLVESSLKKVCRETYKEYSTYRQKRVDSRFLGTDLAQNTKDILLGGRNDRENGNLDENTFSGKNSKIAATLGEEFSRTHLVSKDVLEAFDKGVIHIHDFSKYHLGDHNCSTLDLEDLLSRGFSTKNGGVRPPKSIRSALDLTYLLIGTVSQNQFGGCAIAGFDTCLAPYLKMTFDKNVAIACDVFDISDPSLISGKKDWSKVDYQMIEDIQKAHSLALRYTKDELYQAMEGFFHNLSTAHTREANQLSFSSINYGNDTSLEAVMIAECILATRSKGIGPNKEIPIFPIGIFQYSPCLHGEGKPLEWLFDKAVESTSKNIYPNYVYVSDEMSNLPWRAKPSTMGCRTMNNEDRFSSELDRTGRGNISPVTLSLPYIALEANCDYDKFLSLLKDYLKLTEKALLERYAYQSSQKGKNAPFLYENNVLKSDVPIGPEDSVEPALKHGSLVFGYLGLAEALVALFGKHHAESEDVYLKGLDIIKSIKSYATEAGNRNNLNMSLYATPAESLCMKARDKALRDFGKIEGVTTREYFTNSHHVPVYYPITAFDKIALEAPFSKLATAGTILYNELSGDAIDNIPAVKALVRKAMDSEVQYYAVNIPRDTCNECGHKGYDLTACPKCGSSEIKQLRRITGYTTSEVKYMNDGKQAEVRDRVKHMNFNAIEKLI